MKHLKLIFACLLTAIFSIGQVWAETVTYTVTSKTAVSTSGIAPDGSSASLAVDNGTNAKEQLTSGNTMTLTLSGYAGYKITAISLSMKSNSSKGAGSFEAVAGTTTIFSIADSKFNTANWNGAWSTTYVNITPAIDDDDYEILENEDVVMTIIASANSIYCQSFTITYEEAGSTCQQLAAPANPSSTPAQTSVELNWDAVESASGYKVVFNGTDYDIASGITTKTIEDLAMETEYHWTVAAKGDGTTYCAAGTATAQQSVTTLDACTANKAVYTVASKTSVTPSGALEGSTATFANTYNTKDQMTSGNSQTLTLSGYDGATIKGLTLSMHSNGSAGAGTFSLVIGSTTVASISTATNFNKWFDNDTYGTNYRNVHVSFEDDVVVGTNEDIVVTIAATVNSLYCQSFSFCYEEPAAAPVEKPTFSVAGGTYLAAQSVELSCATAGADIYYTMGENPANPTSASTPYTGAIAVSSTTTIKAIAIKGSDESAIASASYTIVVTEHAGTEADPYSVADAKIVIDAVGTKENAYVSGIVSSIYSTSLEAGGAISFYISADGATSGQQLEAYKCLSLNSEAFTALSDVKTGATVVITGTLKKFSSTYEFDQNCHLVSYVAPAAPKQSIANDQANPYTVAQALVYAADGLTYDLDDYVYVRGVVYSVQNFNNGAMNIFIKDANAENQFELFKCAGINDGSATTPFEALSDVQEGDIVIGYGQLTVFNTTYEFKQGNYLVELNRKQDPGISWDPESAELTLNDYLTPADYPEPELIILADFGDNNPLDFISLSSDNESLATINKTNDGQIKISWVPDVSGTVHFTATFAGNETYKPATAICTVTINPDPASLSPWATTYTSNITLSTEGGTSASVAKVKFDGEETEYAAIKAGVSATAGAVVVSVPAGATALHFHAYSWYNETVELTVSAPAGVTVTPSTAIAINKNSGIKENSPFTLAEASTPQYDAYFVVSLSGNSEPVALTISATSGKRFVLFGVNQEGGVVLESIAVSGTASVLEYTDGQHFDPTGLTVTGTYTDASTAPITEDIVWAFDPDPLTEGTTSVSVTATAAGFTSAAFVVNGLTVAGAAPLSPWATTWTSNLDDIAGSKVKFYGEETEYAALKAGTGSVAGTATLNIPAQATELHLHAYGWNSEDVTLSITAPAGVTVTPASITLNRNAGFASNSPFTLAEGSTPQTDAYYALSLSGNTDAIELTITATAGKRFLLFGVNQVGGVLPVLDHIAITGTMTNTTGWKTGDDITPEGLTVNAYYTLNEVEQAPVDVTSSVVWSHAALVENQTEVTLTATYEGKTANTNVIIEAVETGAPTISTNPESYLNFGSSVQKDAVVAAKTITVTLKNIATATATLGGDNYSAFSIDDTEIVDGDVITVSVNTATVGVYAGTVTIKDDASDTEKVITLSMTVVAPEVPETPVSTTSKWVPATEIVDGMQVLIVGVKNEKVYAVGAQTSNNRTAVEGSLSEGVFTPGENSMRFTIVEQADGSYALQASNGKYLYAAGSGSGKNYLRSQDEVDDNAKWTLSVSSATANGTNTNNKLQLNNSSDIFSCYSSTQKAIQFYVPKPETPEPPVEDWVEVRTGLEVNRHYTVCLEKNITNIDGATFWSLDKRNEAGTLAYLEEEIAPEAGKPYIIQATKATLKVVYGNETAGAPVENGALRGTFVNMNAAALAAAGTNIYMLFNNELRPIGSDNHLDAHRAYVLYNELQAVSADPLPAPGRRVKGMPMQGTEAQGVDNLNASEKPVKMMIDGQLFIIRGEKMFDATGRLVK